MKLGICFSIIVAVAAAGCTPGTQVPPQTVATTISDVEAGLNAAKCLLTEVPANKAKGMTEAQAIDVAIATCGLQAIKDAPAKTQAVMDSHRRAEVIEGVR